MAASPGIKPAIKAVLYRNTASDGTKYATPTWTAVDHVRDVSAATPWDMASADIRATRVKLYHPTQQDFAFSAVVRCDDANAGYQALLAASQEGTALDLLILDGPIGVEGSAGVRAFFHVSNTGQDQAIGNVLYSTFDLKPGFGVNDSGAAAYPKYAVAGASGAMTFADPG